MRNKALGSKHEQHLVCLVKTDRSKYKPNTNQNGHVSKIYCCTCEKPLNFASIDEWNYWNDKKYIDMKYIDFITDFITNGYKRPVYNPIKSDIDETKIIYLNTSFQDRYLVKNLGAKWNPQLKKWYIFNTHKNIDKLLPWINLDDQIKIDLPKPIIKPKFDNDYLHNYYDESHNFGVFRLQQMLKF